MDMTELVEALKELDRLYIQKMDYYRAKHIRDDALEEKYNLLKEQIESAYPSMKVVYMAHALVPDSQNEQK